MQSLFTSKKKRSHDEMCLNKLEQPTDDDVCQVCGRTDGGESMLLCGDGHGRGCDKGFHMHCLKPAILALPEDNWYCSLCAGTAVSTPDADWKDRPRSFSNPANVTAARALLRKPHVLPLTNFVEQLRREFDPHVPDFDPIGGGVNSRVLFLMEAPSGNGVGRGSTKAGVGSGMICPNNDDPTATIDWSLKADAGMPREFTLVWNACPCYVGTATKLRKPTMGDLKGVSPHLISLLKLLPHLKVIITLGAVPRDFWQKHVWGDDDLQAKVRAACTNGPVTVIHSRHPSPRSINQFKGARAALLACYTKYVLLFYVLSLPDGTELRTELSHRAAELATQPRPATWQHFDRSTNELGGRPL
jgi:hypothetical protein